MKAALIKAYGGPENRVIGEHPKPDVGPGEALISVKACGLNHLDIFVRRGIPGSHLTLPHVSGGDVAGVVAEVAPDVTDVKPGDRVLVDPLIQGKALGEDWPGGLAEFVSVPAVNCIPLPEDLSFVQAASLPIAYGTAWRMLITRGRLQAGETVVILGASGGVGTAAVQIAKLAGCRVMACASSSWKLERLQEIGADVLINYKEENFSRRVWQETDKVGADMVVDYTGKATWQDSIRCTRAGGRIVTCGATSGYEAATDLRYVWVREIDVLGSNGWERQDLLILLDLVRRGLIKPIIDQVLPLDDIKEGERLLEERRVFGKVIMTV